MQRCQRTPQRFVEIRTALGRHQQLQRQERGPIVGYREDSGDANHVCFRKPTKPTRLRLEHAGRRAGVRLDEDALARAERNLEGLIDVPAAQSLRAPYPRAESLLEAGA